MKKLAAIQKIVRWSTPALLILGLVTTSAEAALVCRPVHNLVGPGWHRVCRQVVLAPRVIVPRYRWDNAWVGRPWRGCVGCRWR